jgi:REP element-mobilizing transposase RayT
MARPLRRPQPKTTWLVTSRTLHEEFLFTLDPGLVSALGACIAIAARRYFLQVHALVFLQNHLHLILTLTLPNLHLAMRQLLSQLAFTVNQHLGRTGKVFARRYSAEEILDNDALEQKFAYVHANPCNANLVDLATEWPGLSSAAAVMAGETMTFTKTNWTRYRLAVRHHPDVQPEDFAETHVLELTPLPAWAGLPPEEQRRRAVEAIRAAEQEARGKRQAEGKSVLPRKKLLRTRPTLRPKRPKRSPRPLCHTSSDARRREYREAWKIFQEAYAEASYAFRNGELLTPFPRWSLRPPLLDVS